MNVQAGHAAKEAGTLPKQELCVANVLYHNFHPVLKLFLVRYGTGCICWASFTKTLKPKKKEQLGMPVQGSNV